MIDIARKLCGRCRDHKPLTEFYRSSRSSDGRQNWCKACSLAAVKKYQRRIGRSIVHRSVKYGLTPDEVRDILDVPACQACGASFSGSFERKFDHCHAGNHFRGVLCHLCNMACAGTSRDVIPRLSACIAYLQRDLERVDEQG